MSVIPTGAQETEARQLPSGQPELAALWDQFKKKEKKETKYMKI